jgi:hypothetical protein
MTTKKYKGSYSPYFTLGLARPSSVQVKTVRKCYTDAILKNGLYEI